MDPLGCECEKAPIFQNLIDIAEKLKIQRRVKRHKENVLAINASRLLCQRRGAIKMLIELDLNVR